MEMDVLMLTNAELEIIHVIKMLLASINKELLIANVSVDSTAMAMIVKI